MSKYQKINVKPGVIAAIVGFFAVIIVLIIALTPTAAKTFKEDYEFNKSEDAEFVFNITTAKKVLKKVEKEDNFILIIGSTQCSVCVSTMRFYNSEFAANKEELVPHVGNKIQYVSAADSGVYNLLIELAIISEGATEFSTPQVLVFKDGNLTLSFTSAENMSPKNNAKEFYTQVLKKF